MELQANGQLANLQSKNGEEMQLKITVCEFLDAPDDFAQEWEQLVSHVNTESSDVILLPEMPFYPWFARTRLYDPAIWQEAVTAHDVWQKRFNELAPAIVLGSRPVNDDDCRLNEGFIWEKWNGYHTAHRKYHLPDEEGCWESSWYHRGEYDFTPIESGTLQMGFLICTELWDMEQARRYGRAGVHLILNPRATERATLDKWLAGGRTAAIVSGAFALSSNRVNSEGQSPEFGGQGWVIDPDGQVLGITSRQHPFVTVEIDVSEAERAKGTYPRYVFK